MGGGVPLTKVAALALVVSVLLPTGSAHGAATLRVPGDYPTIQLAVNAATRGDVVLVSPGVYDRFDFKGKRITVESRDGPEVTTVDAQGANWAVRFDNNETRESVLRGFTIRNAGSSGSGPFASAVLMDRSSPTIAENIIRDNVSCDSPVQARFSSALIVDNLITFNDQKGCSGGLGGGAYVRGDGFEIRGNTISNNSHDDGGGLYIHGTGLVTQNLVIHNEAGSVGGGIRSDGTTTPDLEILAIANNVIAFNRAGTGDSTGKSGGGIAGDAALIANNTIAYNTARDGSALDLIRSTGLVVNNVIVGKGRGETLHCDIDVPVLDHNNIFHADGRALFGGECSNVIGQDGNISVEPLLTGPLSGDLRPSFDSPVIDAGTATDAPLVDIEGNARPFDGDGSGTSEFDMGAYEFRPSASSIRGTVAESEGQSVLSDVCVSAYAAGGPLVASSETNIEGAYEVGLAPGEYEVEFSDCHKGLYLAEWYDDSPQRSGASAVAVVADTVTTGLDAVLDAGPSCNGEVPTIYGTAGDDVIEGTDGRDVILGLEGNDVIRGKGGPDIICGDEGNDTIDGGFGNDLLIGGKGRDELIGGRGADRTNGGAGNDTVVAGRGFDTVDGGPGVDLIDYRTATEVNVNLTTGKATGLDTDELTNIENVYGSWTGYDRLVGNESANRLVGFGKDDQLIGKGGADVLIGGRGRDFINGGPGNDIIQGGDGKDRILGGAGSDTIDGGSRRDVLSYEDATRGVRIDLVAQTATGFGEDQIVLIEDVIGSDFNDRIAGDGGKNALIGRSGDDIITGDASADVLLGGAGDDVLVGGAGDDELHGGSGADTLRGYEGSDLLAGGAHNDTLVGGRGADLLAGEAGDDSLDGGLGFDTASWQFATNGIVADLRTNVATGQGTDTMVAIEDMVGGKGADELIGNSEVNWIFGLGRADTLAGLDGADVIVGGGGPDQLSGGNGDDILDGESGLDTLDGGPGSDTCLNGEQRTNCESTSLEPAGEVEPDRRVQRILVLMRRYDFLSESVVPSWEPALR